MSGVNEFEIVKPPHIWHCGSGILRKERLVEGKHHIIFGDAVVYYDRSRKMMECGIAIGTQDGELVLFHHGHRFGGLQSRLFVKVYRQNSAGNWINATHGFDQAWMNWHELSEFFIDSCQFENELSSLSEKTASLEYFFQWSFSPEYRIFVEAVQKRNRLFRNHFTEDGSPFDMKEYSSMGSFTLANVAAIIGNDEKSNWTTNRDLSTMYNLVRETPDRMVSKQN